MVYFVVRRPAKPMENGKIASIINPKP